MGSASFLELARLCEGLEGIASKRRMVELVSGFLRNLKEDELAPAVRMIIGRPLDEQDPKELGLSFASIVDVVSDLTGVSPSKFSEFYQATGDVGESVKLAFQQARQIAMQKTLLEVPLTILEVQCALDAIASATGPRSRIRKESVLRSLFSRSSPIEAKCLVKVIGSEMRHGFSEGLMEEAIARAFGAQLELVRKANMLAGSLGFVAQIAKKEGARGLASVTISVFRPVKPMLAEAAENVREALREHGGETCFEYKLDGARIQIHKRGTEVRIFSRRLSDVTRSLPDVVEVVRRELRALEAVVEGEVVALSTDGKPKPFQHLMRRFRRIQDVEALIHKIPVRLYLFDALYVNGEILIDKSYVERRKLLKQIAGSIPLTKSLITRSVEEAEPMLQDALAEGHEGLIAKQLNSPYVPSMRGKRWLKIKPVLDTLDLAIVAADYGHGYRHAWLSDYYLAARNPGTGEFEVIGKCYTGLTDKEIEEMTQRLLNLKIGQRGRTVFVEPKVVVEVAFAEVQKSPHYDSGYALRFARIVRIRDDKPPTEADTIQRVREIYERQFLAKGK